MVKNKKKKVEMNYKRKNKKASKKSKAVNTIVRRKDKGNGIVTDVGTLIHYKLGSEDKINYENDNKRLFEEIINAIGVEDISTVSDYKNLLQLMLKELEKKMKELVENCNLYDLIYWTRRIRPDKSYTTNDMTVRLYREVMMCAIIKYSIYRADLFEYNGGSVLPLYLKDISMTKIISNNLSLTHDVEEKTIELLSTCYRLEFLSYYYTYTHQRFKIIEKGGQLVTNKERGFDVISSEDIEFLIDLFDKRLEKDNILSFVGGFAEEEPKINDNALELLTTLYIENSYGHNIKDLLNKMSMDKIHFMEEDFISNFIPSIISLEEYYKFSLIFEGQFFDYFGFSVTDFICFIDTLGSSNLTQCKLSSKYLTSLVQRAYTFYNKDEFIDKLSAASKLAYEKVGQEVPEDVVEKFERIFIYLSLNQVIKEDINLVTRGPRKIFIPLNDKIGIIDYSAIASVLATVLLPISRINDERGTYFESITKDKVVEVFGDKSIWLYQQKIENGKREKREVDISFVHNNILFLLECKSTVASLGTIIGDEQSIAFRIDKCKKAIIQADKTLNFIIDNRESLNHKLPKEVSAIVSLIVTPLSEYIWERTEDLFLTNDIPRIITPNDLNDIKNLKLCNMKEKSFVKILSKLSS